MRCASRPTGPLRPVQRVLNPPTFVQVYDTDGEVVVCIEDHKFQPRNFWNGRWRSEWHIKPSGDVTAVLRVQVHYYEDGNVQLSSNKEVSSSIAKGDEAGMAQKLFKLVLDSENEYQVRGGGGVGARASAGRDEGQPGRPWPRLLDACGMECAVD